MVNQVFGMLKGQYGMAVDKNAILKKMREKPHTL